MTQKDSDPYELPSESMPDTRIEEKGLSPEIDNGRRDMDTRPDAVSHSVTITTTITPITTTQKEEGQMETRRTVNRIPENTMLTKDNCLKYLDKPINLKSDVKIYHNGQLLEKGTHYEFVVNKEVGGEFLGLKLKVQLQPNDRLQWE